MKNTHNPTPAHQQVQSDEPVEVAQPVAAGSDGIDRRNFLSCMAWAGTGLLWTMAGGVPTSKLFAATAHAAGGAQDIDVEARRLPAFGDQDDVVVGTAVLDVQQHVALFERHRPQAIGAYLVEMVERGLLHFTRTSGKDDEVAVFEIRRSQNRRD